MFTHILIHVTLRWVSSFSLSLSSTLNAPWALSLLSWVSLVAVPRFFLLYDALLGWTMLMFAFENHDVSVFALSTSLSPFSWTVWLGRWRLDKKVRWRDWHAWLIIEPSRRHWKDLAVWSHFSVLFTNEWSDSVGLLDIAVIVRQGIAILKACWLQLYIACVHVLATLSGLGTWSVIACRLRVAVNHNDFWVLATRLVLALFSLSPLSFCLAILL